MIYDLGEKAAKRIADYIYGEVLESDDWELFEDFYVPFEEENSFAISALQIVLILFFWKIISSGFGQMVKEIVDYTNKLLFECELEDEFYLQVTYITASIVLIILGFMTSKLARIMSGNHKIFFCFNSIFFEYNTVHKKKFLKPFFKPVRKIIKTYVIVLGFMAVLLGFWHKFSVDRLIVIYLFFLIQRVFNRYTRLEYEVKLNEVPEDIRKGTVRLYMDKVEGNQDILLGKKLLIGCLPETNKEKKYETKEEKFLYYNTGNLDHLELMKRLLTEESVLIDTPFYADMGVALFMPLHNALLKGKKIIFFSGGSERREEMKAWVKDNLQKVTSMEECWRIVSLAEQNSDWDVGMITIEDLTLLYEIKDLLTNPEGFVIVLLHPARLLMEAQNELYEWGYLLSLESIKPVYVVMERAMLGLLDLLSHVFRTEFKHVSKAAHSANITCTCILDAGRRDVYINKMNMVSMVGVGGMASVLAKSAGFSNVEWWIGDRLPFYDINSILNQHAVLTAKTTEKPVEEFGLIQCKSGLWGVSRKKSLFLVIEDDINNVLELVRQTQTRGIECNMITVISGRYMLLPYMIDKMELLMNDIYIIPSMSASYSETSLNRGVVLMKVLLHRGMEAEEIRTFRSRYSSQKCTAEMEILTQEEEDGIEDEIKRCVGNGIEVKLIKKFNQGSRERYTYHLRNTQELLRRYELLTAPAVYFDEEEQKRTLLGGKHFWQIDQEYLPDQIAMFDGKLYKILGRDKIYNEGLLEQVLRVRRYREGIIYHHRYYQDRIYYLNGNVNEVYDQEKFGLSWGVVHVDYSVETKGYYTVKSEEKEDKLDYTVVSGVEERDYTGQAKDRKNGIILKVDGWGKDWREREVYAIILSEIMRTLFPEGWQYIAVLPVPEGDRTDELKHLYYRINRRNADTGCEQYNFLILEDSLLELGIVHMINQHMEHIWRIAYSYCKWWEEKKSGLEKYAYSFWKTKEWEKSMAKTEALTGILDKMAFGVLTEFRNQEAKSVQKPMDKAKFCQSCWTVISEKKMCGECCMSSLEQPEYKRLFEMACWILSTRFQMEIDFYVDIVVKKTRIGNKCVKLAGNKLYCSPEMKSYAALAHIIRSLVFLWEKRHLSSKQKIEGRKCYKGMKKVIANWYEVYFMNQYGWIEYAKNRDTWLRRKRFKFFSCGKYCKLNNPLAENSAKPLEKILSGSAE